MRRSRRTRNLTRLTALLLALVLLLGGCAAPADGGTPPPEEAGASGNGTEVSGNEAEPPEEAGAPEGEAELPPVMIDTGDEGSAALLERMGLLESETRDLTSEDVGEINGAVAGMRAAYVAGPGGKDPLVKERDWSVYTSSLGAENLTKREAAFYNDLDKMCLDYLKSSALDGAVCKFSDGTVWRVTETVAFRGYGLSDSQAWAVAYWFKWNHPQYYFLTNAIATYPGDSLCFKLYDFVIDGEDRAEVTNELFDRLEDWVREVDENSTTTYEKEFNANQLICESVTYNHDALKKGYDEEEGRCQSLYSVIMLEDTVCAGYSLVFTALMSALGVDATAGISETHAWNVVRYDDGNYYAVDVCWNDTDSDPAYGTYYLNIGEEIMSIDNGTNESHTYEDDLASFIPALAAESLGLSEDALQQMIDAPENLRAEEVRTDRLALVWDETQNLPGYNLDYEIVLFEAGSRENVWYKRYSSRPYWAFGSYVPFQPGTSYELAVRARYEKIGNYKEQLCSDWVYLSVTMPADGSAPADGQLAVPANARTYTNEDGQAVTVWDAVPGATVYELCLYADAAYSKVWDDCSYTFDSAQAVGWSGMVTGATYYFGVRAGMEVSGETVYSDWVNFSYTHTGN